jgi:putative DNA primase/helicase
VMRQLDSAYMYTGNDRLYHRYDAGIYKKMDPESMNDQLLTMVNKYVKEAVKTACWGIARKGGDEVKAISKIYRSAVMQLESRNFTKSCVEAFKTLMLDYAAEEKFNTIRYMIACDNGVFDLSERVFRAARADKYFSMTTGFDYEPATFEPIDGLVDSLYPRKDTAHCVKKLLGKTLEAGNPEQLAYFFHGAGSNGKSFVNSLNKAGLGDWAVQMKLCYFTGVDKDAEGASPYVLSLRNVRVAIVNETAQDIKFQATKFRAITGNDPLIGWQLYGKVITQFTPALKPFIFTNDLPTFTEAGYSIVQRNRVIRHPFTFADEADLKSDNPNMKLKIEGLDKILGQSGNSIFNMFLHYYYVAKEEGMTLPADIKAATDDYKKDLDAVAAFVGERTTQLKDSYIEFAELYEQFLRYMELTQQEFSKIRFSKELGNQGISVKTQTVDRRNAKYVLHYAWKVETRQPEQKVSHFKYENDDDDESDNL